MSQQKGKWYYHQITINEDPWLGRGVYPSVDLAWWGGDPKNMTSFAQLYKRGNPIKCLTVFVWPKLCSLPCSFVWQVHTDEDLMYFDNLSTSHHNYWQAKLRGFCKFWIYKHKLFFTNPLQINALATPRLSSVYTGSRLKADMPSGLMEWPKGH